MTIYDLLTVSAVAVCSSWIAVAAFYALLFGVFDRATGPKGDKGEPGDCCCHCSCKKT